ncbi:MAG: hypothetical protein K0U13_02010 [Chlamydiae bacterium]|nr:hypothetical protein [Chlamydiota bacterium]
MRWFWLGFFCLVVAILAFLPTILSTDRGKDLLVSWINSGISGELRVEELHLSWRGPQKAKNLKLTDQRGVTIASVESLSTNTSLVTLIFNRHSYGSTTVMRPSLLLERTQGGHSNLEKSLAKKPKKGTKSHWPHLRGRLLLEEGQVRFSGPYLEEITINDLNLDYDPHKKLFHLKATTKEGGVTGQILASGSLADKRHILAQIDNFPVAILDQLTDSEVYTKMVGEKIDIKIESQNGAVSAKVTSRLLNGEVQGKIEGERFVIDPASALKFVITPAFFSELVSSDLKESWQLAERTTLLFDITKGEIPLSLDWKQSLIEAHVNLERAELLHVKLEHYSINQLHGSFESHDGTTIKLSGEIVGKEKSQLQAEVQFKNDVASYHIHADGFPFSLVELAFEEASALTQFFGDSIGIDIKGNYSDEKGLHSEVAINSFMTDFSGEIVGKKLSDLTFNLDGTRRFTGGMKETLGEKTSFAFHGKAEMVKRILSISTFEGQINNDVIATKVEGQLGKKGTPFSFDYVKVEGKGELLGLPLNQHYADAKFKEGSFSVNLDGAKNKLVVKTKSSFEADGKKEVDATCTVRNFIQNNRIDYSRAAINFQGKLEHFPSAVLDLFTPEHIDLVTLIGPWVTLKATLDYAPQKQTRFVLDLDAKAPGFSTKLAIAVDPTFQITQKTPGHIHWEITDERYEALAQILSKGESMNYKLQRDSALDIEIESIHCPSEFPDSVKSFVCRSGLVGTISIAPLAFKNPETGDSFTIEKIEGGIFGENFSRKIHSNLYGELSSKGHFTAEVDLLNLWSSEPLALSGGFDLTQIPVHQILGIIPLNPIFRQKAEAIMGDRLDAQMQAQISENSGPISLEIHASNFKGSFPLQLEDDRILLRDILKAEITFTGAISEHFITDINPMIVQGARSKHPIRIFIDPDGFSFPIPWSFKELTIEKAVIDVGKIFVKNGGAVEELMKFLKAKPPKDKLMRAWFTPVFFSLKNGVLYHERFDILLHKDVHIALWGRIDLIKQKVWMTLGIDSKTLKQRFKILGLSKKDMFQVKMRGKADAVELDWSSAYTRIGILIARLAGGPPGYIVGGILEQVISALGEEPTPPPTVYPFPWDKSSGKKEKGAPEVENPPTSTQQKANKKLLELLLP